MTTFEKFGLNGSDLVEMEAFHSAKVEEAVNYFTNKSTEIQETPDLIGEIYSDYEETMQEFFAMGMEAFV
jgi:hypothetical protein